MYPFFVLSTIVAVLLCGLTIDIGIMERTHDGMQSAADAAALGAQVSHDQEDTSWLTNGSSDAATNNFTNGVNGVTVTVNENPASGSYAGEYDAIQATITQSVHSNFMGWLNSGVETVTATAVSLMTPCVYVTGAHSSTSPTYPLSLTSTSSLGYTSGSTMGCPVYVNRGLNVDSSSKLWANATNVVGASSASSLSGTAYHQPRYNATAQSDPLVYTAACSTLSSSCVNGTAYGITPPSFSSCTSPYTNHTWASGGTYVLNPGTYCNSFSFTNSTVTLNSGLYIITGGGTWSGSHVSGTGVTLYFTKGGGSNFGQFKVTNTPMTLSAPTTASGGSIPTILIMNDPAWTQTAVQDFQFTSSSTNSGDGIIYLVGTGIELSSSAFTATHYLCFDVDNMLLVGTALKPLSNFTTVPTGEPFTPMGGLVQ
jgi:Flp pilus assembly protein TadG